MNRAKVKKLCSGFRFYDYYTFLFFCGGGILRLAEFLFSKEI